jgi:hypothetical protein
MSPTATLVTVVVTMAAVTLAALTPANYPPCATEDSSWCVWGPDAGNGTGDILINLWDDAYVRISR